jgi:hypothetical protein
MSLEKKKSKIVVLKRRARAETNAHDPAALCLAFGERIEQMARELENATPFDVPADWFWLRRAWLALTRAAEDLCDAAVELDSDDKGDQA